MSPDLIQEALMKCIRFLPYCCMKWISKANNSFLWEHKSPYKYQSVARCCKFLKICHKNRLALVMQSCWAELQRDIMGLPMTVT